MLANFHICVIMLSLRTVFNTLVRNASPGGPMCLRCMYCDCDPNEHLSVNSIYIVMFLYVVN